MKRTALPLLLLLAACDDFPRDRAEACLLDKARTATEALTSAGSFLNSLAGKAESKPDAGSVTFANITFGTCTETAPDTQTCSVEYQMDFAGEAGQALVDIARTLGQDIEARRLETWTFRFGPTITECSPA